MAILTTGALDAGAAAVAASAAAAALAATNKKATAKDETLDVINSFPAACPEALHMIPILQTFALLVRHRGLLW